MNQPNPSDQQNQRPPGWDEILNVLPESLHSAIIPTLEKWDQGVNSKLEEVRTKYDPYKDFVENEVDPEYLSQALALVNNLQTQPDRVIKDAIEAFELTPEQLGIVLQQQAANEELSNVTSGYEGDDPQIKALTETVAQLQSQLQTDAQRREEQERVSSAEQTLQALHNTHGEFDDMVIMAYMSNGLDGAEAVKRYNETVNQAAEKLANENPGNQQQQEVIEPPAVLGGNSGSGSGLASEAIRLGDLSKQDTRSLVAQALAAANTNNS